MDNQRSTSVLQFNSSGCKLNAQECTFLQSLDSTIGKEHLQCYISHCKFFSPHRQLIKQNQCFLYYTTNWNHLLTHKAHCTAVNLITPYALLSFLNKSTS